MRRLVLAFFLLALCVPAFAVEPDEVLDNPALEARARGISKELRCLVCQNESIDDSNADLAKDLRLLVRERLVQGDSDDDVVAYIVSRYGDFVLLKPPLDMRTVLLWGAPFFTLLAGGLIIWRRIKLARPGGEERALDAQEKMKLADRLSGASRSEER